MATKSLYPELDGRNRGLLVAHSESAVTLCRAFVILLGLAIWSLLYADALCAYRLPKGWRKSATQLSLVFGAAGLFILQVNLMNRFAPGDSPRKSFFLLCPNRMRRWAGVDFLYALTGKTEKKKNICYPAEPQ